MSMQLEVLRKTVAEYEERYGKLILQGLEDGIDELDDLGQDGDDSLGLDEGLTEDASV